MRVNNLNEKDQTSPTPNLLKKFVDLGGHLAQEQSRRSPNMIKFLSKYCENTDTIDPVESAKCIEAATNLTIKCSQSCANFLIVTAPNKHASFVRDFSKKIGCFYIASKWQSGTLTNWLNTRERIDSILFWELAHDRIEPIFNTKKEMQLMQKKVQKIKKNFEGVLNMQSLPDVVLFTSEYDNKIAIKECWDLGIPTIALLDSGSDASYITIPIPCNNASTSLIKFIFNYMWGF